MSTPKVTKAMREWCRLLALGGSIKGWIGTSTGCSANNAHGVLCPITYVMVDKLLDAGLIQWEEYHFLPDCSAKRTRAILTEAGRDAACSNGYTPATAITQGNDGTHQ